MTKPSPDRTKPSPDSQKYSQESKTADATTVAWMLTMIATLLAEVVAVLAWAWIRWVGLESIPKGILVLPLVMWATAVVTGTLNLLLGAIAHRVRSVPAPLSIIIASGIIGIAPILALLLLWS